MQNPIVKVLALLMFASMITACDGEPGAIGPKSTLEAVIYRASKFNTSPERFRELLRGKALEKYGNEQGAKLLYERAQAINSDLTQIKVAETRREVLKQLNSVCGQSLLEKLRSDFTVNSATSTGMNVTLILRCGKKGTEMSRCVVEDIAL